MSNATISKPTRRRPGLYVGTLTLDGRTFEWLIERGEAHENCHPADAGWWRIVVDGDSSGFDYPTKRAALATLDFDFQIDPQWGLCYA